MYTNQIWLNTWLTKNSLLVSNTKNGPSHMNGQIRPLLHFFLKGNFCWPSLQISFRKVLLILFLQGKFCSWIQCSYVLSSWTKAPGTLPSRPFIYMCTCAFLWTCALQLCQLSLYCCFCYGWSFFTSIALDYMYLWECFLHLIALCYIYGTFVPFRVSGPLPLLNHLPLFSDNLMSIHSLWNRVLY